MVEPPPAVHYKALDELRGIAALAVFFLHKALYFNTPLRNLDLIRHFYLMLDIFFVLSGFVIAANYQQRLLQKTITPLKFILLRLGRLYPLHFVLLMIMGMQVLLAHHCASQGAGNNFWDFISNILLLQSLLIHDPMCLNGPSWSISSEFWTYVLFSSLLLLSCTIFIQRWQKWVLPMALILILSCLLLAACFLETGMIGTYQENYYGMLRCIVDFGLGVTLFNIFPYFRRAIDRVGGGGGGGRPPPR